MDLKEIQNLIKFVAKSGANEVKLEMGDVKITIKTGPKGMRQITFNNLPDPDAIQVQPEVKVAPPCST